MDIEPIVREVLRQLASAQLTNGKADGKAQTNPKVSAAGELKIADKVVTLKVLAERLQGIRSLVVPAKAIVTPAARDLLRHHDVAVSYACKTCNDKTGSAANRVVIGEAETKQDAAAMVRDLSQQGATIERIARSGLGTVVAEMAELIVKGGYVGVLLSDSPAGALCLANRHRGVRAVTVVAGNDSARAIEEIGANMLIVSSREIGYYPTKQLLATFVRDGARPCPAAYAQWLG